MLANLDADFIHRRDGESIAFAAPYSGRREIDLPTEEMPAKRLRHRRAYRISRAGAKHGLRAVYYGGLHPGGAPASCPAGIGAQPFQCNAATRVKIRRAVSWSQSSLPLSRSMSRSAASL